MHKANILYRSGGVLKTFLGVIFFASFLLVQDRIVFPAEDVSQLIRQGENALGRGDYAQAKALGQRIVAEDPGNLTGYKFALIYCLVTWNEAGFNRIVEEAKKQGDPKIMDIFVTQMVAQILYAGGQTSMASDRLLEYETKWREVYDKSG